MHLVAGANLFGQWMSEDQIYSKFEKTTPCAKNSHLAKAELQCITWSYNVFKAGNEFYLSGSWRGKENQVHKVCLPDECNNSEFELIVAGNDYHLLIVNTRTYTVWILSLEVENKVKKINLQVEAPLNTHSIPKKVCREDKVTKVVATNSSCLFLSSGGSVYSGLLPSHLDTSHCEGRVCDIHCGYEHFVLLTDSGKVYTWGNGRRLQLGHGDLDNLEFPTEVEALAGIKIVKISAGGWHSLALSEFGDVYAWGWNDTGQLGIKAQPDVKEHGVLNKGGIKSYPIPTLVDIYDENGKEVNINAKDIACGSRHSAIKLEDNSVWTTGFNKYGQLGFSPELYPTVNYFKKSFTCANGLQLICGPWSTVLWNNCLNK